MNRKMGGLGKGLGALLDDYRENTNGIKEIQINLIKHSPYQPRTVIDTTTIQELAQSIQENGLIEPLVVRFIDGYYELIAGHRRLEALKFLDFVKAPVYILDIGDKQAAQLTIIENIQREDLNPIDLAQSLENLIRLFSLTHEECSHSIGKSRVYVTNILRLLKLDFPTIDALKKGLIQESHARLLLSVSEEETRSVFLQQIIEKNLSVKELDILLKKSCGKKRKKTERYPHFKHQEERLGRFLNKPVKVFHHTLQIKFKDEEELRDIFQQFQLPYEEDECI